MAWLDEGIRPLQQLLRLYRCWLLALQVQIRAAIQIGTRTQFNIKSERVQAMLAQMVPAP